jgi:O-antigen/teichoic acid export membrane protein
MAGNVLSQAIALIILPILTRYLSPAEYGIFNYTSTVQSFVFIFSTLSLNLFLMRYYFEAENENEKKKLFGTVFLFIFTLNFILLLLEFLIFPIAITKFNISVPFHPYFKIAIIINFLEVASIIPLAHYRVTKRAWSYFFLSSSKAIFTILLSIIFVVGYDMGIMGRYYGILVINIIYLVIYIVIIQKISKISYDWSIIKRGLQFSLPILPATFASTAIMSLDRIVLERYVSISQLGLYSVGVTLGSVIMIIVRGYYYAIEPDIYQSFRTEQFNQKILKLKNMFLSTILGIGCIFIVFCREIVSIFASEQFYECYMIIPFFIIASVFRGAEMLMGVTLYALKKTTYEPIIVCGGLLVNIVSNLILIPRMGILGAAISSLLSFYTIFLLSSRITEKLTTIRWGYIKDTFIILLFTGMSLVFMNFQTEKLLLTIFLKIIILCAIFLVSAFFIYKKFNKRVNNLIA